MVDVTEILVHWHAGRSHSEIATSLGVDRKTLKKYLAPAVEAGIVPGGPAKPVAEWEALVCNWFPEIVDMRVRQTTWPEIDKHREYIVAMLAAGVSKATIWQRLRDELGLTASVASLKRYVAANLPEEGQRARVTVLRADPPPGEEAQIDYGYLGVVDRPGRWPHPADLGVRDGAGVLPVDVRAAGAADGPARLDRGARGGVRVLRRLCGCRYLDSSRNGVRMGVARDGERRCCGHHAWCVRPVRAVRFGPVSVTPLSMTT